MVDLKINVPEEFYNEEIKCEFCISSKMKSIWAVQIDLMEELLRVCKKYDLKIFASDGTLLGAVRHRGYIPWDDDIDFSMFRKDYEKLKLIAEKEFVHPYFFQTEYSDPGCLRGHAQLRNSETTAILGSEKDSGKRCEFNQGIFIDIWVMDAVVDDDAMLKKQKKDAEKYLKIVKKISRFSHRYVQPKNNIKAWLKKCLYPFVFFIIDRLRLEQYFFRKYEDVCMRYDDVDTKNVAIIEYTFDFNRISKKSRVAFDQVIDADFEFTKIPIPKGYDDILSVEYGDYMKFKKGDSFHGNVIYDVDKSYREYI